MLYVYASILSIIVYIL